MFSWIGLLEASVTGGLCIVLCAFVSMLCKERYRARYKKILWLLIALRLCIPVSMSFFPQPFTIQLPVYVPGERESGQGIKNDSNTNVSEGLDGVIIDSGIPDAAETGKILNSSALDIIGNNADNSTPDIIGNNTGSSASEVTGNSTVNNMLHQADLGDILVGIWACGSLIVLLYYFIGHLMFHRCMMQRSEVCREENILRAVSEIAAQLKLKRVPQIRIANRMETGPFSIGFFHNKIVLPDADYEEKDLQYVIRHELVHCAGRDAQLKVIFVLANIIHWFNPLVWLMKTLADQDIELACDEKVLAASTKDERKEYSEVIMSYITAEVPGKSVIFTGYAHDFKFLKKRFSGIFNTHKKSGKFIGCLLVVLLILVSGMIGFETGQTVYARGNGEMDSDEESRGDSVPGLTGYGDFSNTGSFQRFLNDFFNGESYSSTDPDEYFQFEGFRGKSALSIFPETIEDAEVIDYLYRYMDTLFDPTAEIYLECRYDEETYQTEIARLEGIYAEHKGEIQTILYDTESFAYPAYVTINGNDHCYEYALLLGDGRIAYIHMEFIKEEEIAFPADYLPKAYEEEDQGYSMYIFYQKDGSGYIVTSSDFRYR